MARLPYPLIVYPFFTLKCFVGAWYGHLARTSYFLFFVFFLRSFVLLLWMEYLLHGLADGQLVEHAETRRYGLHERVEEVAGCAVATVEHRDVAELHLLERL